jgi:hypothetical protein
MFIFSIKLSRPKIIAFSLIGALVFSIVVFGYTTTRNLSEKKVKSTPTTLVASTNEQKIAYLKSFGWEVDPTPCEIIEVIIPTEFNDIYTNYNNIQKKQGFDLEKLKGKRAKRWTYQVTNYPKPIDNVRANIIEYNSKIIGGDICSYEPDGFIHGFSLK